MTWAFLSGQMRITTSSHLRHKHETFNQCCTYQEPLESSEKLDDVLLLVILITYLKFKFVSTSSAGSEEEDFEGFEEDEFDYLSS